MNFRAVTIFVLSFFPFFPFVIFSRACQQYSHENWIRPLPWQVKGFCHLFQFWREEFQADVHRIFVFLVLSVYNIFAVIHELHRRKNKPQPRTVWCLIFYFCISPRTYKRGRDFVLIFFLGDRTSAPDVFISCSFTSLARILRQVQWWSVSMVTRYDVISSRWSSHFWVKIHVFSTSFNNKSKSCG